LSKRKYFVDAKKRAGRESLSEQENNTQIGVFEGWVAWVVDEYIGRIGRLFESGEVGKKFDGDFNFWIVGFLFRFRFFAVLAFSGLFVHLLYPRWRNL